MSIRRVIKCEGCGTEYREADFGTGFPGWCIIQGVAKEPPPQDRPMRQEDGQSTFCPSCKMLVAEFLDNEFWQSGDRS